jgi:hypothetical protein
MIISVVAILLAIGLTVFMIRREPGAGTQLRSGRPPLIKVGVQIICGDCSGDSEKPRRTCLDIFGRCEDCGGRSYVLASNLAMSASHYHQQSQMLPAGSMSGGRILPFHSQASKRSTSPLPGEVASASYNAGEESAMAAG